MVRYIVSSLLFGICNCAFFQATSVPENNIENILKTPNLEKPVILFLGDSITHGRVSFDYVAHLQKDSKLSDYTLVNEGINSRLTYQIFDQFENIKRINPKVVFVLIGTNDLKATLSESEFESYRNKWNLEEKPTLERYRKNYTRIIHFLQKETNAKIHLISLPVLGESLHSEPLQKTIEYSMVVKNLCEDKKINYIPFNETLIQKLKENSHLVPQGYESNRFKMYLSILKYYSTWKSWNEIGSENGYRFLTDGIHLNETSGLILVKHIRDELTKVGIE